MPPGTDFPFAIRAICDICGQGMQPSKPWCKWNSTRHYAQLHAFEAHGAPETWSANISQAWKQAKRMFEEGSDEVFIEGDSDSPGTTLVRVDF